MASKPARQRARGALGFTLIELAVVVAIVAILATIAYPTYSNYLVKGRRSAAQAALLDIAQRQQQYLLDARNYASSLTALNVTPASDVSAYYNITIAASAAAAGTPPSFIATATPIAGKPQAADVTLSINNAGVKTPVNTW
ncbi:type IV pilin protein [Ralstonia sp. SET104]|uniref:type IV pilin protein n=1 Tax=Ralstonia sp. SET104 TaxID=2448774 RepID=UPI000F55B571|nr:type IV pilin protein [Ralstonia sp. SET104]GCB06642.1 pilus assembly protein PilE [Ralstonia sp. SET104]